MMGEEKNDKNSIAAVVILFNPDKRILSNIDSYIHQVDTLYIVDNSSIALSSNLFNGKDNVEYLFSGGNIGVAAALNLAASKSLLKGYQYLLTMDQDSHVPPNMVENLLEIIKQNSSIGIVSPLHSNRFGTHLNKRKGINEVFSVMTSGNILSLEAFNKTGPFSEDYFIDYVDVEYCLRLKKNGYQIICNHNIIMEHNEANISQRNFFNRRIYPPNHNPRRMYYKARNIMLLRKTYKKIYPEYLTGEMKLFIRNILKILLFEEQKFFKVRMVLLGLLDYFVGLKGKKF